MVLQGLKSVSYLTESRYQQK